MNRKEAKQILGKIHIAAVVLFGCVAAASAQCVQSDVVIYGGTPAGIAAAIQAERMGKDALILEPTGHVGGMMGSGLTRTDASPRRGVYGGIVQEFFDKAIEYYQLTDTRRVYFESKWAEATLQDMAESAGAEIVFGQRISSADTREGRIVSIQMISGDKYCGDVFIDASYEGDLAFRSGVTTTFGREARSKYGEALAGVQELRTPRLGDDEIFINPYVDPADPESGLIYGVAPYEKRTLGAADNRIMAFNYRLCVTADPDNRVPFTRPEGYDPARYEGVARVAAAVEKFKGRTIAATHFVGGGKTVRNKQDVNSHRWFSTNVWHIGADYIQGDYAERERIAADVRAHIEGLFWFAVTDPRLPNHTRNHTNKFGWCADEFTDNGNFPRLMYVREGRRIVGDFVLNQNHIETKPSFHDTIGLGYYPMDEHGIYRTVVDGYIAEEYRHSAAAGVYEIPYRALLPRRAEMRNLLVPVGASVSHVAFTSVRVEPTFMVLGQAAGAAAALASAGDVTTVDTEVLRDKLASTGQVLLRPGRRPKPRD